MIRQLATCRWIDEHQQVLVTGATGTGKSFVACALARQACRRGFRAYYRRASRLFDDLRLARADGTYGRLLASSLGWTSSSSMTGAWLRRRTGNGVTSSRFSRTVTAAAPRSSPASCHRPSSTITSASPRWPTPSAIGSSTTPTESCYKVPHAERHARQLIDRPASLRSDHDPDRRVHDGPIWVFSFAGIRREARATWPQVSSEGLRNRGSSCILRSRVGAPRPPESVYRRHEHPLPDRRCPPSKPVAPRDR